MSELNPSEPRILLDRDRDGKWYVRSVCLVYVDHESGNKIYHCDEPIGGAYESLADVPEVAALIEAAVQEYKDQFDTPGPDC